jgi:hypothetical protein
MVRIGIGVAGRTGIEMAARGGEVRSALADGVEMDPVHAGSESRDRQSDVDDLAGALLALDQIRGSADALALDRRACADDAGA